MTTRYFVFLSFKGTKYFGWQIQPNSITVQKVVDEALSTILREKISTIGAGRTDSGVHAKFFCAHFDSIYNDLETRKNLLTRLNRFLPVDIAVQRIKKVRNDAHARYSAVSRTYKYYITKNKDPFSEDTSWFVPYHLDLDCMNKACLILTKHSDFTSFSKLHSNAKTNICNIHYAKWEDEDNLLIFTIKADRFLRNMVRAIVGTMVELGRKKINLDDFEKIINARDRCKAGKSVPAKGLFLEDIEYPGDIFS
ncbi:MAG TPA: tRNA pseudouridine(38-40) synthase TruA [Bacteroidales bacterium]|nr:tRNA pseudouridine(38-40) synthase TruA [Bacteroidales bacterium]HOK75429.1 tRNA pseudouridine(38-40) synthase TruA [Bacteroidales bacterium]HOM39690.1 tRNA pseudouridine(38-40) synthase TruA [Bacteroidales bacterium]HOU30847.1 tRNA pseudouridine(38-40) synthase TruA [Bacteroidales bacterium]HPP92028.1 tRNA pseudouridine(38-40) synthase TruA [Bacteroidales bacterium]